MSTEPELVIFDLDGVLVDTQDAEDGALAHLGGLMGLAIDDEQQRELFSGKRIQECVDLLAGLAQRPAPDGAVALVRAKCEELIGHRSILIDGVADVLELFHARNVGMCVASNSPREIIERRLADAGVLHYFGDRLFSAYDVSAWKPDPTLFRWAAAECGAAVGDCVVVEDSMVGVESALAAGMRVFQYRPLPAADPCRAGVELLSSLRDLPRLIRTSEPMSGVTR